MPHPRIKASAIVLALIALGLALHGAISARQPAKTDQDRMQGVWRVLTLEVEGRYVPDEQAEKFKFAFAKDKLLIISAGKARLRTVKLDAKATPKAIDLVEPENQHAALGIYDIDGDTLKISLADPGGKKRPTQFATEEIRNVVFVLERTKVEVGEKSAEELIKQYEQSAPGEASEASSANLRALGIAMHNYHNDYLTLPPPATYAKDGKPLLSWRVAVLPYVEQDQLYRKFKLNEPWDSEANKPLLAEMPAIFAPVRGKSKEPFATYYRVFVSGANVRPGALFVENGKVTLGQVTVQDGTSNTAMIVEAADAVPWTKPDELVYDPQKPLPKLGGLFEQGFHCCFADCSIQFIRKDIYKDEAALHAIITRNGGEVTDVKKYFRP